MSDFSFEIVEHIGKLGQESNGWQKELNRVSYGGRSPKYDIRAWDPDHQKMTKGITLSQEEFDDLKALLG
ncbi:MAG: PC4/YdbC family ssDNA-binding protein [Tissierellia bacterium]|nr:PC4/YdbC family ssDNA-binding protein [Tissierellia bacterium]